MERRPRRKFTAEYKAARLLMLPRHLHQRSEQLEGAFALRFRGEFVDEFEGEEPTERCFDSVADRLVATLTWRARRAQGGSGGSCFRPSSGS